MKRNICALAAVFILVLAFSACASPPIEEMQKAEDAVTRAENDADAVAYAGNLVTHARDALTRMQSEAESKRYDVAKEFAAEAIRNAERAISEGQSGKERSKAEAGALLDSVQNSLAETSNAIDNARNVPNIQLDFDALTQDTGEAHETYGEARQSFQDGDNPDAIAKGQAARDLLSDINAKVNEAAFDTSRKQ
jgi:uncharacterized protein (DUF305 family)